MNELESLKKLVAVTLANIESVYNRERAEFDQTNDFNRKNYLSTRTILLHQFGYDLLEISKKINRL